ncbi:MAG: hypothetical protein QM747_03885 [Nocardioides sp.]
MTIRDSEADISVPVTCARTVFDSLNPPLVEGASVVIHAKPDYYANRGSLSAWWPARSGWSASASCSPASSADASCWRRRASSRPSRKQPLPVLPARASAW